MFDAWDMNHAEAVLERLFFEIAKTDVGNVFDTSIPKDFKEGFAIHSYDKVVTAQYKEASFVRCVDHCKGLALDGCIAGFGGVGKTTSDQGNFPAMVFFRIFSLPFGPFFQRRLSLAEQLGVWGSCGRLTPVPNKCI